MSHPQLNQLTRAEELFDAGKLDEALEILNDWSQFEGLNSQQKEYFQFLKGLILFYQNKCDELIEFGEQIFKVGQKLNENLKLVDGLFFILSGLCLAEKFKEAFQKIENAEVSLGLISNVSKNILFQRKVRIRVLKAWINLMIGNIDLAEKCLEWILNSQKELVNTFEIVWANLMMARLMYQGKRRYYLCGEYTKKALSIAKQIKFNHFWIALSQLFLGVLHSSLGEIDIGLKHYMKSLAIFREIKNNQYIAHLLNNIGVYHFQIGEYDLAFENFEEALLIFDPETNVFPLSNLIEAALEKGDIERAQKYFQRLEDMYNQEKDEAIILIYQFTKALMLKNSSRIRDKAKVEELLKQVIKTETIHFGLIIDALVRLCDLLLSEYHLNNNSKVLDELNHYIAKLLTIAEKSHSYLVFCETFILQAKLALINFNVKSARRYLTQAQKIAESYGLKRLTMKISYEHDELLRQIKSWKTFKESEASLSERLELTGLNEQMENMVKKRMIEVPEISKEDPVMLLILTEGGNLLFSKKFVEDFSFEDDILGGFLTTINYVISEVFSEGLDRAVFGQYTLLMLPAHPFLACYIFKGDSYFAHHNNKNFLNAIQNDNVIWQTLQNFFQKSKSVQLDDVPSLELLIKEIFVEKKE